MAKISAKKSDLKTIANKIIVSPSTAAVSDLKFKRKKDFKTFVKWIESSNKALAGIKLPSKKEVEKLGKSSGGGFPWLLLGLGSLLGLGALVASKGKTDKETGEKVGLGKKVEQATNVSGKIPKNIKIPNFKKINVKTGGIKNIKNIKSGSLKNLNKGIKPKVTNTGKGVKVIRPKGGSSIGFETGKGKFTSTPGKAPSIPKKVGTTNKIVQNVSKPFKNIRLNKGLIGFGRTALNTVGKGLAILDAGFSTKHRLDQGQTIKQSVVGGVSEAAGSWYGFGAGFKLGSVVTGKLAAPLLLAPFPGARPLWGVATLAGGIAGGFAGSDIGRSMAGGLADKFTGVLTKAQGKEQKKSVTEKKKEENNITSGETTVPVPIITSGSDNNSTTIPVPIGDVGSNNTSSSSAAVPFDSGLNNTLSDLLLTNLK